MEQKELDEFLTTSAREMAEGAATAVLGTLDEEGYPYTSSVEVIFDGRKHFWLLLSNLAVHTSNIGRDVRASLWIGGDVDEDEGMLASTRGSFVGRITEMDRQRDQIGPLYLESHPQAKRFMNFSDFRFYRFQVERVRVIAGFGRIGWVDGAALQSKEAQREEPSG